MIYIYIGLDFTFLHLFLRVANKYLVNVSKHLDHITQTSFQHIFESRFSPIKMRIKMRKMRMY